jgi:hypothetical protein
VGSLRVAYSPSLRSRPLVPEDIATRRLAAQHVARPALASAHEVVAHLGAVQAQDYAASLWALGLRMRRPSLARVLAAIERGEILRTWPMRGTLHFVTARDARWMIDLLASRAMGRAAGRHRELGITSATLTVARRALVAALKGGGRLTRPRAYDVLAKAGLRTSGQRGVHIVGHLAQEGTLCVGPHDGKQSTIVLLDEWASGAWHPRSREDALAEVARRFVTSHAPATLQDLAWWTGLTLADARAALAGAGGAVRESEDGWIAASPRRVTREASPAAHVLPAFDEFAVAYKDRSAALARVPKRVLTPQIGLLSPSIVVDGQMVGSWGRRLTKDRVEVSLKPMLRWSREEHEAIEGAAERYAKFLGLELRVALQRGA